MCSIERTLYTHLGPNLDVDEENLSQSKKSENQKIVKSRFIMCFLYSAVEIPSSFDYEIINKRMP